MGLGATASYRWSYPVRQKARVLTVIGIQLILPGREERGSRDWYFDGSLERALWNTNGSLERALWYSDGSLEKAL